VLGRILSFRNRPCSVSPCSRWAELTTVMQFHMKLAHVGRIPSEFRLLNSLTPIMLGVGNPNEQALINQYENAFSSSPNGGNSSVWRPN
jgi:hypothetical protein